MTLCENRTAQPKRTSPGTSRHQRGPIALLALLLLVVTPRITTAVDLDAEAISPAAPVVCWGYEQPTIPQNLTAIQVAPGRFGSCALLHDGNAQCWGSQLYEELDLLSSSEQPYSQLTIGLDVACGIVSASSSAACHGDPQNPIISSLPNSGLHQFRTLHLGARFACGILSNDEIFCWGDNATGVLAVPSGAFSQVASGDHHACATRLGDSTAVCWGNNSNGQLNVPTNVDFYQVCAGDTMSCGIFKSNDTVRCWPPIPGTPAGKFASISCGWGSVCGITAFGEATCWGNNNAGQWNVPSGLAFRRVVNHYTTICGLVASSPEQSPSLSPSPSSSVTPSVSRSPSPSASISSSPSPSPSFTPPRSPSPSTSVSPSTSPTLSPSPFSSPSTSPTPFVSPSSSFIPPSPSPSPISLTVVPITNVTASFDEEEPGVSLVSSDPTLEQNGNTTTVTVKSGDVLINNSSLALSSYEVSRIVSNATSTFIYSATISDGERRRRRGEELVTANSSQATLEQHFIFHRERVVYNYTGTSFAVPETAVKWTIAVNVPSGSGQELENGLTMRYPLSTHAVSQANSTTASIQSSGSASVFVLRNHPQEGVTTYILPISSSSRPTAQRLAMQVEVFDMAIVDDVPTLIEHDVLVSESNDEATAAYTLELRFPGFNRSLHYDPNLSMGRLVGTDPSSSTSDDTNIGLIVGAVVGVSGAIVLVAAVVVGGVIAVRIRRGRRVRATSTGAVNFNYDLDEGDAL